MSTERKLAVLSDAAKYDASCASSGSSRSSATGLGSCATGGICHSWSADGRCISLLKILFTNRCMYDCAYCRNRCSNDVPRASFTVDEVVDLTVNFYRRNYIEGLFLSSGVTGSPDDTLERMVAVAERLRRCEDFGGYIHLKAIPGAATDLVLRAGAAADRVSVNIELPSEESLRLLAPQKTREGILRPMKAVGARCAETAEERRRRRRPPPFAPAGQSTQIVVGATPENDFRILHLAEALYRNYGLKRVYYSAYVPVNDDSRLPALRDPPLLREHRLYQADWLVRFYGFHADELLSAEAGNLDARLDPKAAWAVRHPEYFPTEVNTAPYEQLLRVPGIGVQSARRICAARRFGSVSLEDLKKMGVVLKRAQFFITVRGAYFAGRRLDPNRIRHCLISGNAAAATGYWQPDLLDAGT